MSVVIPMSQSPSPPTRGNDAMTVASLLALVADGLSSAGIPDARAEARDLIAAVTGNTRFWPIAHPASPVAPQDVDRIWRAARRRERGSPFAYAAGVAAFRHLSLRVDDRVLIPRQETEVLVDLVLRATAGWRDATLADVGTGSGAIVLALATESGGRFARLIATDVSRDALAVAAQNAVQCAVPRPLLELRHGSGLAPLRGETLDVLIANPPYIAPDEVAALPRSVRDWEPVPALVSGEGGLALTREIVLGAPDLLRSGGLIALECDERRARDVSNLLADTGSFHDVCVHSDLAGRDRFVIATRA